MDGVPLNRLAWLLTLLALLIAPLGMGGHAWAMSGAFQPAATHRAMPSGHCSGMDGDHSPQKAPPAVDCTIACSALPAVAAPLAEPLSLDGPMPGSRLSPAPPGIHPKADPPPPRA